MKHSIRKQVVAAFIAAVLFVGTAQSVSASGIYGQYGGTSTPAKIVVDKVVRHPVTGEYVDNLGLADPKYSAEQTVFFKITVRNTGGSTLPAVRVEDYLPPYVAFIAGGSYDANKRVVYVTYVDLAPNESKSFEIQAKVLPLVKLPAEKAVLCPVNKVAALTVEHGNDEDTAQFCIAKQGPAPVTPQTGDPMGLMLALGAIPAAFAGWKMRKVS